MYALTLTKGGTSRRPLISPVNPPKVDEIEKVLVSKKKQGID